MWNAVLDFFGNPWMFTFLLIFAPFIWGFFHLAPSDHKPEKPMDQFHMMIEKGKEKAIKKAIKEAQKNNKS